METRLDSRLAGVGDGRNREMLVKGYRPPVTRWVSSGHLLPGDYNQQYYSIDLNLLRQYILMYLNVLTTTTQQNCICEINLTAVIISQDICLSNHYMYIIFVYKHTQCYTLYVNYIVIKLEKRKTINVL